MPLKSLRTLLEQGYSFEVCTGILSETATLYREPITFRWYFLLVNRIFGEIVNNPDFHEADMVDPILQVVFQQSLNGLDAVEAGDTQAALRCANELTEAYTAFP